LGGACGSGTSGLPEFYRLEVHLSRYSKRGLSFAVGTEILVQAFPEEYCEKLDAGACEGRLFRQWEPVVV
jgi:hypothetical protein